MNKANLIVEVSIFYESEALKASTRIPNLSGKVPTFA